MVCSVCAGMIGCKLLAATPSRVASLTMISTTIAGWNMALTMLRRPWITLRVRVSSPVIIVILILISLHELFLLDVYCDVSGGAGPRKGVV